MDLGFLVGLMHDFFQRQSSDRTQVDSLFYLFVNLPDQGLFRIEWLAALSSQKLDGKKTQTILSPLTTYKPKGTSSTPSSNE